MIEGDKPPIENLPPDDQIRIVGYDIEEKDINRYLGLMTKPEKIQGYIKLGLTTGVIRVLKTVVAALDKIIPK